MLLKNQSHPTKSSNNQGLPHTANLTFWGNLWRPKTVFNNPWDDDYILNNYFEYDHMGRLLKQYQNMNDDYNKLISWNKYNRFGQLEQKAVGGSYTASSSYGAAALQMVDYKYNIRWWLKSVNDPDSRMSSSTDLFAFKLNYDDTQFDGATGLYNGNIAETIWRSKSDDLRRGYYYSYDALNRLTDANYATRYTVTTGVKESFNEGGIQYDKNGNIQALTRTGDNVIGMDIIDDLTYSYVPYSNRLASVYDAAGGQGFNNGTTGTDDDYTYDQEGNMIADNNKGILDIDYNHLNLPVKITFSGTDKTIEYRYTATGEKLQKKVTNGGNITTTKYINGFVYENDVLKFFSHPEGYVDCEDGFTYIYQYKDHLGNVRLSYKGTQGNLTVQEQNHYYPFGLKMGIPGSVTNSTNIGLKYKYNGKELQDELGLNMYDYGARNYDPALGRWMNIDPKAEVSRRWPPYTYCYNNPMRFTDPDGMKADDFIFSYLDENGKSQEYRFTGDRNSQAPTEYIQQFQDAYFYNVDNGGGMAMKYVAESSDILVSVQNAPGTLTPQTVPGYELNNTHAITNWNPLFGSENSDGNFSSPATLLEHDIAHAIGYAKFPETVEQNAKTPDVQYQTKEERRVTAGFEELTAIANGEVPRKDHQGIPVITESPTSTKVNMAATSNFYNNYEGTIIMSTPNGTVTSDKYKTP